MFEIFHLRSCPYLEDSAWTPLRSNNNPRKTVSKQCFLKLLDVYGHLGILLRCQLWFCRSGDEPVASAFLTSPVMLVDYCCVDQTLTNRTSEHICVMLEDQNTCQRAELSGNSKKANPVVDTLLVGVRHVYLWGTWARCRGLMRDPLLVYAGESRKDGNHCGEGNRGEAGNRAFESSCFVHAQLPSHVQLRDPKD